MALTDQLLLHYKLNEAAGNNRNDSIGSNHLSEQGGTVASGAGIVGNCAVFNQTNYLAVADNPVISQTGDITIWFACQISSSITAGFGGIIGKWAADNRSYAVYFNLANNRIMFLVSSTGTGATVSMPANNFGNVPRDTWIFGKVWVDHANDIAGIKINNNPSFVDTTSWTAASIFDGNASLEIGRQGVSTEVLHGKVDTVFMWSRVTSDTEDAQVFNSGNGLELGAAPTANAGLDQTRDELTTAMLDSSQSTDAVGISSRLWEQVSGTPVTLINATAEYATFVTPDVSTAETLVFKVTITNTESQTAEDQVSVRVVPANSTEWRTAVPREVGINPAAFYAALNNLLSPSVVIHRGKIIGSKGDITLEGYCWSASKQILSLVFARLLFLETLDYTDVIPGSDNPTSPTATAEQFLANISDYGLTPHAPGNNYAYNNAGWHHFGTYMKETFFTDDDHVEFLQNALVTALNFEDALTYNAAGFMSGWDGGWHLSTRDLARLCQLVLQRGAWGGTQLLSSSFIDELYTNKIPAEAEASTFNSDEFFNQVAVTAQLPGAFSYGWWRAQFKTMGGSMAANEAAVMSGAFGTSAFVSRKKQLLVVACNVGGTVTNDDTVKNSGASFDAVANAVPDLAVGPALFRGRWITDEDDPVLQTVANVPTLVVDIASHSHTAQNVVLTQVHNLVVQDGSHGHSAENVAVVQNSNLAVQNSEHGHSAGNVALTQVHALAVDNASHSHTAQSPALTQEHALAVANAQHGHSADNLTLSQFHALAVQDATHDHTADNVTLDHSAMLEVQNASHGHAADSPTLSQVHNLAVNSASHAHNADSLSLSQVHNLTPADAQHSHSAENLALTQVHALDLQSASHGHTADNLTLTQVHALAVAGATHGHTAQNVDVTSAGDLVVQNAEHGHTAENAVLTQLHVLSVNNAEHAHAADSPALTQTHALVVQSATHQHDAQSVTVAVIHNLAIDSATHGHAADNVEVLSMIGLIVQNATHAHNADNLALVQNIDLFVANAEHGHASENLTITQTHNLGVQNAVHVQNSDHVSVAVTYILVVQNAQHGHIAEHVLWPNIIRSTSTARFATIAGNRPGERTGRTSATVKRGR